MAAAPAVAKPSMIGGSNTPGDLLGLFGLAGGMGAFGGAPTVNNPNTGQVSGNYNTAGTDATTLSNTGQQETNALTSYLPQYQSTTEGAINTLEQPMGTNTYNELELNRANGDLAGDYQRATANAATELGNRGMAGPGGQSSELAGADTAAALGEAGTSAANEDQEAMGSIAQHYENVTNAAKLSGDLAAQLSGMSTLALSQGGDLADRTGQNWEQAGQDHIQNNQKAQQGAAGGFGSITSAAGSILGLGL